MKITAPGAQPVGTMTEMISATARGLAELAGGDDGDAGILALRAGVALLLTEYTPAQASQWLRSQADELERLNPPGTA